MDGRKPFDLAGEIRRATTGPCFICEMLAGRPGYFHHVVAQDDDAIIFLSRYPTQRGYCLVAPRAHVEDLADGFSRDAYLGLQRRVHDLSRALKHVFDAERIYVLSLGSMAANSHVHFHVVPLPRGVPLARQQYHALMAEHGIVELSETEMQQMAVAIGSAYESRR